MKSIFNSSEYTSLYQEFETLAKLDTTRGDKLAVKEGRLVISEGGFSQAPSRTVKNLIYGGYNRDAVCDHLEKLSQKTANFISELKKDPTYRSAETKDFARKIRQVATVLSSVQYSYRNLTAIPSFKDDTCKKLFVSFNSFYEWGKAFKEELKEVKGFPKTIDFKAPIVLRNWKINLPSHETPADTLKLAEHAEKQIVPTWKKHGVAFLFGLGFGLLSPFLGLLTFLKWMIWNPIECAIRGKISTINPAIWFLETSENFRRAYYSDRAERALELYAQRLLRTPTITAQHVEAFGKLAKYVKEVQLTTAYFTDIHPERLKDKNSSKNTPFIALPELLKIIEIASKVPAIRTLEMPLFSNEHQEVKQALEKAGFKHDLESPWKFDRL